MPKASGSINTIGGFVFVYPAPGFVRDKELTVPTPDKPATAVALVLTVIPIPAKIVPIPAVTPIETVGADVYPEPPSEITKLVIVPAAETIAVAAAPVFL